MQTPLNTECRVKAYLTTWAIGLGVLLSQSAWAVDDFSKAETQLFMTPHLQALKLPRQLSYTFQKSGSLEPHFVDHVHVGVKAKAQGRCCATQVTFLSKQRRLQLPEPDEALGNPVILYFLERDIREMQRLTQGQTNFFRSRIRKALYMKATEGQRAFNYKGKSVSAQEFEIIPFVDDPLRERLKSWVDKHYVFTLSPQVPGGVVAIRTWLKTPDGLQTVWQETLLLEGATL
jgi:hypothetical protein